MKKQWITFVLSIPVLIFLVSRMTGFIYDAKGIIIPLWAELVLLGVGLFPAFIFKKKVYDFLDCFAWGFSGIGILIYLLSIILCFRYPGIAFMGASRENIFVLLGAGLSLGVFVLTFAKGMDTVLKKLQNHKVQKKDVLFVLAAAVLLNVLGVLYCLNMKEIFVWDNAGYFTKAHELSKLVGSPELLKVVYHSVFETDYNYIIAVLPAVFARIFGNSRLVFVLSVINCYVVPLIAVLYAAAKIIFKKPYSAILAFVGLPYIIFAANTGFVDIGGVVCTFLATVIFLRSDKEETAVVSGALLAVSVLLRRWYSFYALSFLVVSFLYAMSNKKIKAWILKALSFGFVLLFFAQDFVSTKLLADYKNMYSAYALGIFTDIKIYTRYYGAALTASCVFYAVRTQIKAKTKAMTMEMFLLFQAVLCFLLFASVQTHGQQHLALYIPMYFLLIMSMTKGKYIVFVLCLCSFVSPLILRVQPKSISEIKNVALFPDFSQYPKVDENAEEFLKVTEYMDREIGEKGKTVCFLASSVEMNYDTLKNAEVSLSKKRSSDIDRSDYYLPIGDVDNRDGILPALFEADYILVPSKLQIHLNPEEQEIISVPYNEIVDGRGIGTAYEKQEKVFYLSSKDEIYLYKRIREITDDEIQVIKQRCESF